MFETIGVTHTSGDHTGQGGNARSGLQLGDIMTRTVVSAMLGLLACAVVGGNAAAVPLNTPVPGNATIVFEGLEWAWGGSCPYQGLCGIEENPTAGGGSLAYQGTQGWRLPTALEMGLIPEDFALLFVYSGANVPENGTDPISGATFLSGPVPGAAACAAAYFSTTSNYCDWGDGAAGAWATGPIDEFFEQLYVRVAAPEPASLALFGLGLAGIGLLRRRA